MSDRESNFPSDGYLLDTIMNSAVDCIIIINQLGIIIKFNRSAEHLFGYDAEEVVGNNISILMPSPFSEEHDGYLARYLKTEKATIIGTIREVSGKKKNGEIVPLELSVSAFKRDQIFYFTGILHDITERKNHEKEILQARDRLEERVQERTSQLESANLLLQEKIAANEKANEALQLAAKVFENAGEAILITDPEANIVSVNRAYLDITGFAEEEVIGKNPSLAKSGRHDRHFYKSMWNALLTKGQWKGEVWDRRKNGKHYPKWLNITEVRDHHGVLKNYIGIFTDITTVKETEQQLEALAYYDSLTKLPNRKLFHLRLDHDVETSLRSERGLALLFIDLDKFKQVNDTMGHAAGDELLLQVAERLLKRVRKADTVARLGGDEFTIVLTNIEKEEDVATISKNIIEDLQDPFDLSGQEAHIGASIGISLFPQDGKDSGTLIKHADVAMYQAKSSGRGNYKFFLPEMNALTQHLMQLEINIKKAVEEEQFTVFYQPKVDVVQNRIVGMEALVRWEHPDHGMVSPNEFIPLAEDTGLILPIGHFVLKTACRQTFQWINAGLGEVKIAVNLSARQFNQTADLIKTIEATLAETSLQPENLEVEITESMIMGDMDQAIETMKQIRDLGISIAMDDFGTGYSSLSYLKKFPIQTLKIDRAFIKDIPESQDDATIVSAIISLAANLKMKLVAEGVETQEQIDFLKMRDCHVIQGFFYSPPLPSEKFQAFFEAWPGTKA